LYQPKSSPKKKLIGNWCQRGVAPAYLILNPG